MPGTDPAEQRRRLRAERLHGLAQAGGFAPGRALGLALPDAAAELSESARAERQGTPAGPAPAEGMVTVDAGMLAELHALAAAPEQIAAERAEREREDTVMAALRRGAILPAQARHWRVLLEYDPASGATLAQIPAGASGMSYEPIGYVGGGEDARLPRWV